MGGERRLSLDPRLSMIAEMVGRCECCADIGCDHGRLGAFLLKTGRCARAQLTDISEPSLKKARWLIGRLGLEERMRFCVGDGARALAETPDVAIIAGMGGTTISKILRDGRESLGGARLILQPNVGAPEVRAALEEGGWRIDDERIARDGRRCYAIIAASPGKARYTERERIVGPVLLARMPEELTPYAGFRLRVAKKALAGARSATDAARTAALERETALWEEICGCLRR